MNSFTKLTDTDLLVKKGGQVSTKPGTYTSEFKREAVRFARNYSSVLSAAKDWGMPEARLKMFAAFLPVSSVF